MSDHSPPGGPRIGAAIVSADPLAEDGLAAGMPGELFELVAICDEGMAEPLEYEGPEPCYADFNMLLEDERVELVLVEGPVEKRRDFAVRALNGGRHVVVAQPFAETAVDATRVMKTALKGGLVATTNLAGRDDPDLVSLMSALAAENVSAVHGAMAFRSAPVVPDGTPPGSLLAEVGLEALDQIHLLLRDDVKAVSAHVRESSGGGPDDGFMIYLPLRHGGWAVAHATRRPSPGLPAWVVHTPAMTFTASAGTTTAATADGEERCYATPDAGVGFWQNLFAAIRHGAELKCHPADIVKAMKLHEAAIQAAETGEPVTI
jgi:predicted dehydrogenase